MMKEIAGLFKALSEETRLMCVGLLLQEKELCVCDFEAALGATQSKTSRHLRYLLHMGVVEDRREGIWVFYRLSERFVHEHSDLLNAVRRMTAAELGGALELLRDNRRKNQCIG